jgi:hypothetical protein
MLDSSDKMWAVQQPGTILRARHSAKYGQLALVLARAYPVPDQATAILPASM